MKTAIATVALLVIAFACAAPSYAGKLERKDRRLDREIAHRNKKRDQKFYRWHAKHPRPTNGQQARFDKWLNKHNQITSKRAGKEGVIETRIAERRKQRHR